SAARRRGRGPAVARGRRGEGPRRIGADVGTDVRGHGLRLSVLAPLAGRASARRSRAPPGPDVAGGAPATLGRRPELPEQLAGAFADPDEGDLLEHPDRRRVSGSAGSDGP